MLVEQRALLPRTEDLSAHRSADGDGTLGEGGIRGCDELALRRDDPEPVAVDVEGAGHDVHTHAVVGADQLVAVDGVDRHAEVGELGPPIQLALTDHLHLAHLASTTALPEALTNRSAGSAAESLEVVGSGRLGKRGDDGDGETEHQGETSVEEDGDHRELRRERRPGVAGKKGGC